MEKNHRYHELIRAEGDYWDKAYIEQDKTRHFKCFLHQNPWFRSISIGYVQHLQSMAAKDAKVLDIGCGTGWLSLSLAGAGAEVLGIDIAEQCLANGAARAEELGLEKCRFDRLDMNTDVLPMNSFDIIVSWGALHHIQNTEHAIDQIAAALKPSGRLVLLECVDQAGIRGKLANFLADAAHLLLPTDRTYREKVRFALKKIFRNETEIAWSPMENAGGSSWLKAIEERFEILRKDALCGFLSPFIARLKMPKPIALRLTAVLSAIDRTLMALRIITPEYYFIIAKKPEKKLPN